MDAGCRIWHFSDMAADPAPPLRPASAIPSWNLYGESHVFPDVMHIERITDRAAGLDWRIAPHRHLHLYQFFLIRDGVTRITLDGGTPTLPPPFLLAVPPGVVHGFTFSADMQGFVLTIPLQSLPDLLGGAGPDAGLARPVLLAATNGMERLFHEIHAEHEGDGLARGAMLRALATTLACHVMRAADQAAGGRDPGGDPRLAAFQRLLHRNLRKGWSVADYAREMGISARHLSRICRAATGKSAAALIEAELMHEACRLLVYTRAGVASVGYDLGFEDPSYFSRAFRRATGLSPKDYRAGFERA